MLDLDGHGYTNHGTEEDGFENVRHRFEDDDLNLGFLQLFLPSQFVSEKIKTRLNQPGAYGLFATRDIAAGEGKLVCLPVCLVSVLDMSLPLSFFFLSLSQLT